MKRMIPLFAFTALSALAGGCNFSSDAEARDAGPAVDRTYQVTAFDRVSVAGPYEVTVTTGGHPGVVAHGGEAVLAETEIVVENGKLTIGPKNKKDRRWNWGKDGKVRVDVTTTALRGAAIAGSGTMRIDRVAGGDFEGAVAGSGDLALARWTPARSAWRSPGRAMSARQARPARLT